MGIIFTSVGHLFYPFTTYNPVPHLCLGADLNHISEAASAGRADVLTVNSWTVATSADSPPDGARGPDWNMMESNQLLLSVVILFNFLYFSFSYF